MMAVPTTVPDDGGPPPVISNNPADWVSRHWLPVISVLLLIFVGLPWLAPFFMTLGWNSAGQAIYLIYGILCHQLPQRSFFVFGDNAMLPLGTIQSLWSNSDNPLVLRQFIGNTEVGWKVAWSDRMVYMYTTLLVAGLAFWPVRKRLEPLPWWGLLLFLLPMAVDGLTHMISDMVGGIGGGYRYTNAWLAALTGSTFPSAFYTGDTFGSFNSWMRLLTGVLFGIGVVWFAYPRLDASLKGTTKHIALKFQQVEASMNTRDSS